MCSFLALLMLLDFYGCFAFYESFDSIQPSEELSTLFFDDGSTLAPPLWDVTNMELELEWEFLEESDLDTLIADKSDACHADNFQTFGKKRANEACKNPELQSPDTVPNPIYDGLGFPELERQDEMSIIYPFALPDGNDEICPQPSFGRLYAVCDSGYPSDNRFDPVANAFHLRYCSLYNRITGCGENSNLWCCEYFYMDDLAVRLGLMNDYIAVATFCHTAFPQQSWVPPILGHS
jgi:hypothetical protein